MGVMILVSSASRAQPSPRTPTANVCHLLQDKLSSLRGAFVQIESVKVVDDLAEFSQCIFLYKGDDRFCMFEIGVRRGKLAVQLAHHCISLMRYVSPHHRKVISSKSRISANWFCINPDDINPDDISDRGLEWYNFPSL